VALDFRSRLELSILGKIGIATDILDSFAHLAISSDKLWKSVEFGHC